MQYKIIGILVLVMAFGLGYYKIQALSADNKALEARNQVLETNLEDIRTFVTRQNALRADLTESLQESQRRLDTYVDIFERHDLEYLSYARPGLIERRINDATQNLLREIENETSN